jgi:cytochrome b561
VAIGLHVAAALWHHFVLRDGTLARMLPSLRRRSLAPPVT